MIGNKEFDILKTNELTFAYVKKRIRMNIKVIIYLATALRIETFGSNLLDYQIVTKPNGNWIRYNFSEFDRDDRDF